MSINAVSLGDRDGIVQARTKLPRSHPRVSVEARVELAREGMPERLLVKSLDLSWGGASLLVPERFLERDDALILRFPWAKGESFSARAAVEWNAQIDDRHRLVGVSFHKLGIRDEDRLQQLLSLLLRSGDATAQGQAVADQLDVCFLDRDDVLVALEQIRFGYFETTVFKTYGGNERLRLVLTAFGGLPTLQLRARVLWTKALGAPQGGSTGGMHQLALALDHPEGDLKRAADALTEQLNGGPIREIQSTLTRAA
jgi:hypothetical protein